jgi:SAM-dependent methyltransferase
MTKFTFHHNIPILRRLYLQRDEARNQGDEARRELDVTRNQRDEGLRELDVVRNQRDEALRELGVVRNQRDEALGKLREIRENNCLEFSSVQLVHSVPKPTFVPHSKCLSYLSQNFNKPGVRILEIGSRNVTGGASRAPFSAAHYVGFDFYEGENVDVVGDAHKLSSYFDDDEKFDLIFSSAVFEHFHMPWIVAQEMQKLLKLGGYVFVQTHFSFAAHERPWNFFQFSDMGLRALFNSALGFELVDYGMDNPINGVFSHEADEYLRGKPIHELYCHSMIFCRKARNVLDFDWGKAEIDDIVANTRYPTPKT